MFCILPLFVVSCYQSERVSGVFWTFGCLLMHAQVPSTYAREARVISTARRILLRIQRRNLEVRMDSKCSKFFGTVTVKKHILVIA